MLTRTANGANKKLVLHVQLRCGSLSITTPVSHLANEFDVRSELHGQVYFFNKRIPYSNKYIHVCTKSRKKTNKLTHLK